MVLFSGHWLTAQHDCRAAKKIRDQGHNIFIAAGVTGNVLPGRCEILFCSCGATRCSQNLSQWIIWKNFGQSLQCPGTILSLRPLNSSHSDWR